MNEPDKMRLDADVLIVGGGFAGLSCFRQIDRRRRRVTLLTDRNHFLFTPLLPLAAVGSVVIHITDKKKRYRPA